MSVTIHQGDALKRMREQPAESIHCCVTSPPYWGLRDYGSEGQIGLEASPDLYVDRMVEIFAEARRVLREDGTLWLNMGDRYISRRGGDIGATSKLNGSHRAQTAFRDAEHVSKPAGSPLKHKDLVGMPWRLALALQADGWYLRCDIVWHKPNPMPESVTDRPTKAHEYVFLLSKNEFYFFDQEAVKEPASLDSHARYARGRSKGHKYADGGPGDQTIAKSFERMRTPPVNAPGVNPKAREHKPPSGWDRGNGGHNKLEGRYPRPKQNESFSAAVIDLVDHRNIRSVWTIPTEGFKGAHFATFPTELARRCILAGSPRGGGSTRPLCWRRDDGARRKSTRSIVHRHRTESLVRAHGAETDSRRRAALQRARRCASRGG